MNNGKWDAEDIPGQRGKTVIVTGSSSGIGFETAGILAGKGATVIIAVRNPTKGAAAVNRIKSTYSNCDVILMELDLANLDSVKTFAGNFKKNYSKLDLLVNNAGVMVPPYSKTADGFELQFGTNHLGHFALTGLLMDVIKNSEDARIISVSSAAHKSGNLNFEDLNWEKRKYRAWRAYGDSKIANLYFTYELQRRLDGSNPGIIAAASHPGWTATDLQRYSGITKLLNPLFAQKTYMGALPTLYASTAPDVKGGEFFGPDGWQELRGYPKKVESNKLSHDKKIAERLWTVSEELTGIKF